VCLRVRPAVIFAIISRRVKWYFSVALLVQVRRSLTSLSQANMSQTLNLEKKIRLGTSTVASVVILVRPTTFTIVYHTESIARVCAEHDGHDTARRAGPSESANCLFVAHELN